MNKFANSYLGIGALVLLALFFVYRNIVSPLTSSGTDAVAIIEEDADDWMDSDGLENSEQSLQIASVQYDVGHFLSTGLHWNEHPARDPFKPLSILEVDDVASIANKVQAVASPVARAGRVLKLPTVSAVVKGETINFAVINDRIVTVGDEIAEFRVEQLARASVTLRELATGEIYNVLVKK